MAKKVNVSFGSKTPASPVPQKKHPAVQGTLPLRPAAAIQLTELEKKNLEALGWKEGEPVPNLAARIASEKKAYQQELQTETRKLADSGAPSLEVPEEVRLEDLPPERQEELRRYMQEAQSRPATRQAPPVQHTESVRRAILDSAGLLKKPQEKTREESEQPAPSLKQEPETLTPGAGGLPPEHFCPRCGWDTNQKDSAVVTDQDRQRFVVSVLGGGRFQKSYSLFSGRLTITYRSLTVEEGNSCVRQALLDTRRGSVLGAEEFLNQVLDYRLCLSLEEVSVDDETQVIAPGVDSFIADFKPEKTQAGSTQELPLPADSALPAVLSQVRQLSPLCTEAVWRLAVTTHRAFGRLTEKLEAEAMSPDF